MKLTTRLKWTLLSNALASALVLSAALLGPSKAEPFGAALSTSLHAQEEEPGSPRARAPLTLLQNQRCVLNGTGGWLRRPGPHRHHETPARRSRTDALPPHRGRLPVASVASSMFKGEQMVAALNAAGLDPSSTPDGRFPQVSGMTMKVDQTAPPGSRVRDVRIGGRPIDLELVYTVALSDYQLKGGDGYGMFLGQRLLVGPESSPLVVTALEKYVSARGEVNPGIEGRVQIRQ